MAEYVILISLITVSLVAVIAPLRDGVIGGLKDVTAALNGRG